MTEMEVTRLARIIKMRDDMVDWVESFQLPESAEYLNVTMEVGLRNEDGHGTGWEDEWSVDRLFAIEWFQKGVEMCNRKLRDSGIDTATDSPRGR